MRRYLCTIEEYQENEQRTKRRRIDPVLNEVDIAGRSGLEQQWVNQRQQVAAVEPRNIQNTRRGKNMRLDGTSARIAEYLEKQITKSNQILAEMYVDNDEQEEDYEEIEDIEEDLGISHFDVLDKQEEFQSEVIHSKRLESKNNSTLDGCGKPNSEMLEVMARRQQKFAQKKGQSKKTLNQSKFNTPDASSLAASIIGQVSTHTHEYKSEPMEVDTIPRGRNIRMVKVDTGKLNGTKILSVSHMETDEFEEQQTDNAAQRRGRNKREQLDSSVSQDSGKLTPAMQEILARKQQAASKLGQTKKLDQTVSSTTEFVSSISTSSQPVERQSRLGRKSIRSYKNDASNDTTSVIGMYQQADVAVKKGRSKSLQPDPTVLVTGKDLKTHNESVNQDKGVLEDVGKLTPAMQEILARKQQKIASKQGQNKKLEQTVSSTTETIPIVKRVELSPKLIQEYSKSVEVETKTLRYSKSITENTGKPTSAMQEVLLHKQQQVASKPRKSRKLDQTVTSTVEGSSTKLAPTQSHCEAENKTRRKSTRQPQPNISGAGDSVCHKPQEKNKESQKEDKLDELGSAVSENTSKLTPAMKEILVRKQQKEAASKQGYNKKLNQTITSTTEPVSHAPADQSSIQPNQSNRKPAVNETKTGGGRSTRKSRVDKSTLEVADGSTEKLQQTVDEPVKKGRGKKVSQTVFNTIQSSTASLSELVEDETKRRGRRARKVAPDVSSTTQIEEPSVDVETKTVSARGRRRTTATLLKDSNESTEISSNSVSQVQEEQQTTKRGKKAAARSEDLNTTQNMEKATPAMQQLLAKKQQRALEKSAKGKK